MKIQYVTIMCLLSCLLSSCTSGYIRSDAVAALHSENPDAATVVVIRKSQMSGSGGNVEVLLDGKLIAYIGSGERLEFQVLPGEHFVVVAVPTIFGNRGDMEEVVRFDAEAKQRYYFYYSLSTWGDETFSLKQISSSEGEKVISEHNYKLVTQKR